MYKWIGMMIATVTFLLSSGLHGEITKVKITWNNIGCTASCAELLEKYLKEIPAIAEVRLNAQAGSAELVYKPNSPYEYQPIHYAIARVGITLNDVRMDLRGTISHSGNQIFATSVGDNTKVELLGQQRSSTTQFVEKYNVANYPIDPEMKNALLSAEQKHQIVKIEGTVYMAYRTPLRLIVTSYKVEKVD